jgi:hypothetical protein
MANQTASPHEAEVARRMLAKLRPEPQPQPSQQPYQRHWAADFATANPGGYTLETETYWDYVTGTYRMRPRWSDRNTSYDSTNMSYNDILRRMQRAQDTYEATVRKAKQDEYERRKTAEAPSSREEAEKPHWWDSWHEMHDPEAAEAAQRRRWAEEAAQRRRQAEGMYKSAEEFKRWYQNEVHKDDPERG